MSAYDQKPISNLLMTEGGSETPDGNADRPAGFSMAA